MRLVVASETSEGKRLNESLIKDLTGSERLRGRRMREDFWEFAPTHKVVLLTNHKPAVRGNDDGIWRRPRLVPFEVRFWDPTEPAYPGQDRRPELRQDKELPAKLRNEYPGILAWCARGCVDWQRDGLTLPKKVQEATAEYRNAEDMVGAFIAEQCVQGSHYRYRAGDLYATYRRWAEAAGEEAISRKTFGDAMTTRGFERITSNGTVYLGIGPAQPHEEEVPIPD
jgi:putative DNA primase/helicase